MEEKGHGLEARRTQTSLPQRVAEGGFLGSGGGFPLCSDNAEIYLLYARITTAISRPIQGFYFHSGSETIHGQIGPMSTSDLEC